ncbi:MAG TPA: hypothetical protein VFR58_05180, partial [Flavisolibacter sp.]|nr:hypothetical protein [Flavisolibacter sp.]
MSTVSTIYQGFNSYLSLQPLVVVLKKMIAERKSGAKRLYQGLIQEIESKPELLKPISDISLLDKEMDLVESLLSTIFPPSTTSNQGTYAISFPFREETVYASPGFRDIFMEEGSNTIRFTDLRTNLEVSKANLSLAYDLILHKFYSHPLPITATSVHPFKDESGLTRYYELRLNTQFIDVKCINKDFAMPVNFTPQQTLEVDELRDVFPLENFSFEGLTVIELNDVTQDQVIVEIKTSLLNINSFSDVTVYDELQQHVQSLIGLKNVLIGITPFFKMNGYYLYTESLYRNSLLFKTPEAIEKKERISRMCQETFDASPQPMLYEILNEASTLHNPILKYYHEQGAKSIFLCPLKTDSGNLIGLLEVCSLVAGQLQFHHLTKIQPAIQLFSLALEKSGETLELQIDKMIKEHFTAIQPAVEWKFTEAAFNYLQH